MNRTLTVCYTSDVHGFFSPVDYAADAPAPTGLANCAANFVRDGNSLIVDGGDILQGSPFTYWLHQRAAGEGPGAGASVRDSMVAGEGASEGVGIAGEGTGETATAVKDSERPGEDADQAAAETVGTIAAAIMNLAGYRFVTLGNHDFNYGRGVLEQYLNGLDAVCLCANIRGLPQVRRTAVVVLENGLRVGLTGITTPFITMWEKPEHLTGIMIDDPIEEARKALSELRASQVDLTVCIYHGGFENDVATGRPLSDTAENQAWRICQELDFDILLTGHQHLALPSARIRKTWTCQPPDKARSFVRMEVTVAEDGTVTAESRLQPAGDRTQPEMAAFLEPLDRELACWLDRPVGRLDVPLKPEGHLSMAVHGSLIANFFNQVQMAASGAELSCTSLANDVRGFECDVSIRDVVATYVYPNTLTVLRVSREVLKLALERSAEYFAFDGSTGELRVSDLFLLPKEEHYNFDYLAGIEAKIDLSRPCGDRVRSIRRNGEELPPDRTYTLCLNNYRAAGSGEYGFYADCEVVSSSQTEIVELIMDYIAQHRSITVDKTRWLTVYDGEKQLS